MYPYDLGMSTKTGQLVRLSLNKTIPIGFVRVIRHRANVKHVTDNSPSGYHWEYTGPMISPYDSKTGELLPQYWSIPRVQDLSNAPKQLD